MREKKQTNLNFWTPVSYYTYMYIHAHILLLMCLLPLSYKRDAEELQACRSQVQELEKSVSELLRVQTENQQLKKVRTQESIRSPPMKGRTLLGAHP